MKTSLILAACLSLGLSVAASACTVSDVVFQCTTRNHKVVQICDNNDGTATYRFGRTNLADKTITMPYRYIDTQSGNGVTTVDFRSGAYVYSTAFHLEGVDYASLGSITVLRGPLVIAEINCAGGYVANGDHFWMTVNGQ